MTEPIELINLDKVKKPRKKRTPKIIIEEPVEEEILEEPTEVNDDELQYYRDQLITISDRSPEILTQSINTDYSVIDSMSLDEIKARIRLANRATCSKLDSSVTQNLIMMTNQVTGRLLGCVDELEESTREDKLLHDTAKNYLGLNVLDHIPTEIKLFGLYGSHVANSWVVAKKRTNVSVTEINEN